MKTALSIPENLFRKAGQAAKRLGISRNRLYTLAIQSYLEGIESRQVTMNLNRVYARESSELDLVLAQIQGVSIPSERW